MSVCFQSRCRGMCRLLGVKLIFIFELVLTSALSLDVFHFCVLHKKTLQWHLAYNWVSLHLGRDCQVPLWPRGFTAQTCIMFHTLQRVCESGLLLPCPSCTYYLIFPYRKLPSRMLMSACLFLIVSTSMMSA